MSAWGKTGRVTVVEPTYPLPFVCVDGSQVGWLYSPDSESHQWGARIWEPAGSIDDAHATLDAAVLWVLRRVDPALWRQERGAWLVRKSRPGEFIDSGILTGKTYLTDGDEYPWMIVDPYGASRNAYMTLAHAHDRATAYSADPEAVSW